MDNTLISVKRAYLKKLEWERIRADKERQDAKDALLLFKRKCEEDMQQQQQITTIGHWGILLIALIAAVIIVLGRV